MGGKALDKGGWQQRPMVGCCLLIRMGARHFRGKTVWSMCAICGSTSD